MVNKKVFLDTNIVADMIDASRKGYSSSIKLLEELVVNEYEICISEDMLSTLFYISKDKKRTLEFFENIIYTDWHVLSFGIDVIKKATKLALEQETDLEDLFQCLCAKNNGCEALITNDKNFYNCGIEVLGVEELLERQT